MNMRSEKSKEKVDNALLTSFRRDAEDFMNKLPHKLSPYNGRNWGHPWHSLCSYHGKLKPSIAYHLVKSFSQEGDIVLDPMSGVGTIPFEASLQGRKGIGNDLSELAYVVTKAKVKRPNPEKVESILVQLEQFIELLKKDYSSENLPYKNFGLNKTLPEYFHKETYSEILAARSFFINRISSMDQDEAFIFSCFLHVLHGNRPYALSRRSHPLTPYAPSGEYVYKNVIEHIKRKINLSYSKGTFEGFTEGEALYGDLFDLPNVFDESVDVIITSPPFVSSIKFYKNNWMRLWLTGWEPEDFKKADDIFLENKQDQDINIYKRVFEVFSKVLKPNGRVILHLGKSKKCDMGKELSLCAEEEFHVAYLGTEDVTMLESHGISDKGSTTDHQFLFLCKK